MQQPSARTCLLVSGGIAGAVLGSDLIRLATAGRLPPDRLRHAALAAAALLGAVGLSTRHTHLTLELARRIERARLGPDERAQPGPDRRLGPERTWPRTGQPRSAAPV